MVNAPKAVVIVMARGPGGGVGCDGDSRCHFLVSGSRYRHGDAFAEFDGLEGSEISPAHGHRTRIPLLHHGRVEAVHAGRAVGVGKNADQANDVGRASAT